MAHQSNVIDFASRKKNKQKNTTKVSQNDTNVISMVERRQSVLTEERRQVKRTILTEFIGAFVVVPQKGLQKVALYDISESGVAFDLDHVMGHFKKDEEITLRVYLAHNTYFPLQIRLSNIREESTEQVWRHGGTFVDGALNFEAVQHFVKFLESVSASLKSDTGDRLISNLKS